MKLEHAKYDRTVEIIYKRNWFDIENLASILLEHSIQVKGQSKTICVCVLRASESFGENMKN